MFTNRLMSIKFVALIERAQFAVNDKIYKPGVYIYEGNSDFNGSFLDYFLRESEILHGILLKLFDNSIYILCFLIYLLYLLKKKSKSKKLSKIILISK